MIRSFLPDRFVQLLLGVIVLASLLPVRGQAAETAGWISTIGVFLLFFLNGLRLSREEVLHGIRNWKLQGAIFFWVFGAMAAAGFLAGWATEGWLPAGVALGLVYLGVLPTTVQSATAYNSMAKGNVAASVVASALVNLIGVVLTPVLFASIARASGIVLHSDAAIRIATTLLLPFVLGQIAQARFGHWVRHHRTLTTLLDRGVIALAVYVGFSGAVVAGIWSRVSWQELGVLMLAICALLGFAFGGSWLLGGVLKLSRADRKTLLFSGAQKSVAVGAPLAALLFTGEMAGMVLMPILLYHLLQLVLSAPLAARLSRDA